MILVTVGTSRQQFTRLMDWVGRALEEGVIQDEVLVQHGTAEPPPGCRSAPVLDRASMDEAIRTAAIVVTHAGCGTLIECARKGKKCVVVPRRAGHKEHVNDHQIQLARRVTDLGFGYLVESYDAFEKALTLSPEAYSITPPPQNGVAVAVVKRYLDSVGRR